MTLKSMLESMTGFGRAEYNDNGVRALAEVRSVNYRYTETSFRLPQELQNFESQLKDVVLQHIERGKVNITIELELQEEDLFKVQLNPTAAKAYKKLLEDLRRETDTEEEVRIEHLLQFKEIFGGKELSASEQERMVDTAQKALDQACRELSDMRIKEGERLKEDLTKRIDQIAEHRDKIAELAEHRVPEARRKLQERIQSLLQDQNKVEEERLEQEIALLADRLDISEEVVRLESHLHFFRKSMNAEKSAGRKLNFLVQEIHREVNTIGSKAGNADISHHVVEIKEILENIREQVQNIA